MPHVIHKNEEQYKARYAEKQEWQKKLERLGNAVKFLAFVEYLVSCWWCAEKAPIYILGMSLKDYFGAESWWLVVWLFIGGLLSIPIMMAIFYIGIKLCEEEEGW